MKNKNSVSLETINQIKTLYENENVSLRKLGKIFKFSPEKIKRILVKNNIKITKWSRYKFNENFFETINTEQKAYFLGLLYSDGCILQSKRGGQKSMVLRLQESDIDILEKMKKCMEADSKIYIHSGRQHILGQENHLNQAKLEMVSDKLCDDLIRLGCFQRKTHILEFPTESQVPSRLLRHFIRGYFDGDGCIYGQKQKGSHQLCFFFTITGRKNVCLAIQNQLTENTNLTTTKIVQLFNAHEIFRIVYGGNNNCRKIFDYLYKDATVWLNRKLKKFKEVFSQPTNRIYTPSEVFPLLQGA